MKSKLLNFCMFSIIALSVIYLTINFFSMIFNVSYYSVLANIQNEPRDFVQYRIVKSFIEGINPYKLDSLSGRIPLLYLYTFLQPLCVAGICKIFGISIIGGNLAVNIICIFGTAICLWLILKDSLCKNGMKLALFLLLLVVSGTFFSMFGGTPIFTFRPDALGIFLSSMLLLLIYKFPRRTFIIALITVMLIHTKQILIVMALPIFIYYLINDKILALKYFIWCVVIGIINIVVIYYMFPIHWGETISLLSSQVPVKNIFAAIKNIMRFCKHYFAFGLMGIITILLILHREEGGVIKKIIKFLAGIRNDYLAFIMMNLLSSFVFLVAFFAQNGDDGLKYCFDMMAPSLIILVIYIWKYIRHRDIILLVLITICSLWTWQSFKDIKFDSHDIDNYTNIYDTIKSYDNGEQPIYLGMVANSYLLNDNNAEKNNIWLNDGHLEYFQNPSKFRDYFFLNEIYDAGHKYSQTINNMVTNKEFSLIVTWLERIINPDVLEQNYKVIKEIICVNHLGWKINLKFYVPIDTK